MVEMNLTLQEKLEIILERPNYCQLRAAEDAAASDSEWFQVEIFNQAINLANFTKS